VVKVVLGVKAVLVLIGEGDSFIALNPNQDVALTPAK
jgi:hypothetical protein